MNKTPLHTVILAAALSLTLSAHAQDQPATTTTAAPMAADLTEGEVRKVDKDGQKITLRHGEIKNLDMPGMTMVFRVADAAFLAQVKTGDPVRFRAERVNGAFVVTHMEPQR